MCSVCQSGCSWLGGQPLICRYKLVLWIQAVIILRSYHHCGWKTLDLRRGSDLCVCLCVCPKVEGKMQVTVVCSHMATYVAVLCLWVWYMCPIWFFFCRWKPCWLEWERENGEWKNKKEWLVKKTREWCATDHHPHVRALCVYKFWKSLKLSKVNINYWLRNSYIKLYLNENWNNMRKNLYLKK